MTDKKIYSSLQDIRSESGHQNLVKLEEPAGSKDGSNVVFTTLRTYIVDRNGTDDVTPADVIAYVDNAPVTVSGVATDSGAVTLDSAPEEGSKVLFSYAYSILSSTEVERYREEAIDYVTRRINGIVNFGEWTSDTIPPLVRTVVRIYAAGLILIRDHGLNADNENASKDGYKRLSTAKSLLNDYIDDISTGSGSTARVSAKGVSDGELFVRNRDLSTYNETKSATDAFMRGA